MNPSPAEQRGRLRIETASAARLVAPVWPIERFIAVNPLQGLVEAGFGPAMDEARRWLGVRGWPDASPARPAPRTALERVDHAGGTQVADAVTTQLARWCGLLLDPHGPAERLAADGGVYAAWRALAPHDRHLRRLVGRQARAELASLPERADDAVLAALVRLAVPDAQRVDELRGQLARLPGWSGYARWCDEWATPDDPAPRIHLLDLLAIGLTCDALVVERLGGPVSGPSPVPVGHEPDAEAALDAREQAFRAEFLARIDRPATPEPDAPAAQVVCCIDARSEGLRRQLEAIGPYETLGFAGFFAAAVRFRGLATTEAVPAAPALLVPEIEVDEVAAPGAEGDAERFVRRARGAAGVGESVDDVAHGPLAMYALAEAAGWVLGPVALARTLAPGAGHSSSGTPDTCVDVSGFSAEAKALVAETALRTMGLTSGFAPVVVFCGHGSSSAANPHASALDCGACGGNRGGPNARAAVALCNDPEVRAELATRGIVIPDHTWFVAAEHDTTTDAVTLLDNDRVPVDLTTLAADLAAAGRANAAERSARLPGGDAPARRSADWAQTRPEWGLARNAAFLVAPRRLTRGVDLDGRSFLHSYDAEADVEGTALETILTAPMVVAHWINMSYYGATVDPEVFGAGDKTLHNPVAGVGVLSGPDGDLRPGLPWQSVAGPDGPHHEALRLLTLVVAPRERVEAVVARNPILRDLFDGGWVHLAVRPPEGGPWERRVPGGSWESIAETELVAS